METITIHSSNTASKCSGGVTWGIAASATGCTSAARPRPAHYFCDQLYILIFAFFVF